MMAYHHKLLETSGVTQIYASLLRTIYLLQVAADVIFTVRDCDYSEKYCVCLPKRAYFLKLLLSFEPLEPVTTDILEHLKAGAAFSPS